MIKTISKKLTTWAAGVLGIGVLVAANVPSEGSTFPKPPIVEIGPDSLKDRKGDFYSNEEKNNFDLEDPKGIDQRIEYDPVTGDFIITEKIGEYDYRNPSAVSFDDFIEQQFKKSTADYWQERINGGDLLGKEGADISISDKVKEELEKNLSPFGGNFVDIKPKGNIELIFGGSFQRVDNPTLPERNRRTGGFDFDMNINMSVDGTIGDKLKLGTNYNTQATFDFDNVVKLGFEGNEDQILQNIEAGNVNFPLTSTLITGSQRLFGLKTKLKFGRLSVTSVFSQSKSDRENITIKGGAQTREFELDIYNYDQNRHFFLGHEFRDRYEQHLQTLPQMSSPFNITRIEVWVTNTSGITQNTRDVVGFADLGENKSNHLHDPDKISTNNLPVTSNASNNLYQRLTSTSGVRDLDQVTSVARIDVGLDDIEDFYQTRARKLSTQDFTLSPQLGYVSLNMQLQPDEMLAVAYEYTYQGVVYRVGEFASNQPTDPNNNSVLFLKMLKSVSVRPKKPIWDLMMKNVYSLGAFQISPEDFRFDIFYNDQGENGKQRRLPKGKNTSVASLISLMNLDDLNDRGDRGADGRFDFVEGVTINPSNGRVVFPVLEPFGSHLRKQFADDEKNGLANEYVFDELYDSTRTIADQFPKYRRYSIEGSYQSSSSSEIYLRAFNLPKGSVTVSAGGQQLREGLDYTIDYNLGRVKIINDGILQSGRPINISYENTALFGFNTKTLIGNRFDYWINDNFTIGATHMHLYERPFTPKVNVGDDPIKNTIMGVDFTYGTELPGLTRFIDNLPLLSTKENSSLSLRAEGARFIGKSSNLIGGTGSDGEEALGSVIYVDDFEGSKSTFDLKFPFTAWTLASTPQGSKDELGRVMFPEAELSDSLPYGYNRAKMVWYNLDPLFSEDRAATPQSVRDNREKLLASHFVRIINEQEIFPNRQNNNINLNLSRLPTLDLAYYPTERGPYNYEHAETGEAGVSAGLDKQGKLKDPASRWGGIMRSIETNDFQAANVEFIDFWMMDPYWDRASGNEGELYFNLGTISEDVLKDNRKFFENGLPSPGTEETQVDTTIWSRVPLTQALIQSFDNNPDVLNAQDVGYDGWNSIDEQIRFRSYLTRLEARVNNGTLDQSVYNNALADPSNDDFRSYFDRSFEDEPEVKSILDRYIKFDGAEGNTSTAFDNADQFSTGTNLPNSEDLNRDNTLSRNEEYFQYRVNMFKNMDGNNHPYITDVIEVPSTTYYEENIELPEVRWLHFKIPIDDFTEKVGGIQDFTSIRFIRMFMTGFEDTTIMRMAKLELVRNQWRRYNGNLAEASVNVPVDQADNTFFNVNSVSVEENSSKFPIPYAVPPGVQREEFVGGTTQQVFKQNEQALSLQVCGLKDGDSKAVFRNFDFDYTRYEGLELFVHAESLVNGQVVAPELNNGELEAFIRMGSDFTENYYEYSVPLEVTQPGTFNVENILDQQLIWPESNKMDIKLDDFVETKKTRNGLSEDINVIYSRDMGNGQRMSIRGNPQLSAIKTTMIGLRNPRTGAVLGPELCAEVWVNELRLKGVNQRGGYAALGSANLKMADFADINVSGNYTSIGFGQLEQKIEERSQEELMQYDASANVNLDKFLPKKSGIKIPMYAGISESFSKPQYDPFDGDVELNDKLSAMESKAERKEYLESVQDYQAIKSINFTNVRKEKTGKNRKSHLWDVENLNFTYAFTEDLRSNPTVARDLIQNHRFAAGYNFSTKPKYIEPFKDLIKPKMRVLKLIRDFNLNFVPSKIGLTSDINRQYGELVFRDVSGIAQADTTFNKFLKWNRNYDLQWNLTKSLKLDFTANNIAIVDEPNGPTTQASKDSLWANLKQFGRTRNYKQNVNVQYTVPFNKFPLLDFVNARASYGADYEWLTGPLGIRDSLGNTINNARDIRLNGDLNMRTFYNKFGFIKKVQKPITRNSKEENLKKAKKEKEKRQKSIGMFKDAAQVEKPEKEKKEKDAKKGMHPLKPVVDLITMFKRGSVNYNHNSRTTLPGWMPESRLLGMNPQFRAPGTDFVFGWQPDTSWLTKFVEPNDYLTLVSSVNQQYIQSETENMDAKLNFEPIKSLTIDLNFKRNRTENYSENFVYQDSLDDFIHQSGLIAGSYTISNVSIGSAFDDRIAEDSDFTESYVNFEASREQFSQQFGERNPNSEGVYSKETPDGTEIREEYTEGYGPLSQDILIRSFLNTYTEVDATGSDFDMFKMLPLPNWRVSYNGLTKIPMFKEVFKTFKLSHGYNNTLTVNQFTSDFNYQEITDAAVAIDSLSGNYYSEYIIPQVLISEQFVPLLGLDMSLKNGVFARIEYKQSRNLALSMSDYQIIQTTSKEFTLGGGFRFKGSRLPIKINGIPLENDINFTLDFSIRDDQTINYIIDQGAQRTRGAKTLSLNPKIDYMVNDRVNLRLFYDWRTSTPFTSASYPTGNTKGGVSITFSIAD